MGTIAPNLRATTEEIEEFCRKWKIVRFELFGSALREDFDGNSDVDVLVTFGSGESEKCRIADLLTMEDELQEMFGRQVDLVERRLVETSRNWVRRRNILSSAELVYAAP